VSTRRPVPSVGHGRGAHGRAVAEQGAVDRAKDLGLASQEPGQGCQAEETTHGCRAPHAPAHAWESNISDVISGPPSGRSKPAATQRDRRVPTRR
jgi:hypothetical protein